MYKLAQHIGFPEFAFHVQEFIFWDLNPEETELPEDAGDLPDISEVQIYVHHCATAQFQALCDPSGVNGMKKELIRANPKMGKGGVGRFDTVLINIGEDTDDLPRRTSSIAGTSVARVIRFFSLVYGNTKHSCAFVEWYDYIGTHTDGSTGMWKVKRTKRYIVVNTDTIIRAVHLIPVYGSAFMPDRSKLSPHESLDHFHQFFVNKYVDHHSYEILS